MNDLRSTPHYRACVERRRQFSLSGYPSFADVGLEGEWTTPYHISGCSGSGPVLLSYNYLDAPSAIAHRDKLLKHGFIATMPFNRVLDMALLRLKRSRRDLYLTHTFHLLPQTRSQTIPTTAIDASFEAVARHEIGSRHVVALGKAAARVCRRHGLPHTPVTHLSARGVGFEKKAEWLAEAIRVAEQRTT